MATQTFFTSSVALDTLSAARCLLDLSKIFPKRPAPACVESSSSSPLLMFAKILASMEEECFLIEKHSCLTGSNKAESNGQLGDGFGVHLKETEKGKWENEGVTSLETETCSVTRSGAIVDTPSELITKPKQRNRRRNTRRRTEQEKKIHACQRCHWHESFPTAPSKAKSKGLETRLSPAPEVFAVVVSLRGNTSVMQQDTHSALKEVCSVKSWPTIFYCSEVNWSMGILTYIK